MRCLTSRTSQMALRRVAVMPLQHATLAWQLQAVISEGGQGGLVLSDPNCLLTFCVAFLLRKMGRGCALSACQFLLLFLGFTAYKFTGHFRMIIQWPGFTSTVRPLQQVHCEPTFSTTTWMSGLVSVKARMLYWKARKVKKLWQNSLNFLCSVKQGLCPLLSRSLPWWPGGFYCGNQSGFFFSFCVYKSDRSFF